MQGFPIELPPKFDSESFNTSGASSTQVPLVLLVFTFLPRQVAEHPLSPGSLLHVLYVLYLTRQAAEPPLLSGSLLYVLYVLYLTRQAAEPPLSPGSLLYVLYVLYILYARKFVVYVLYRAI